MYDPVFIGDKVSYVEKGGKSFQHGIVKSYSDDCNKVFVVYNCNGEWDKYEKYGAQLTDIKNLKVGWL